MSRKGFMVIIAIAVASLMMLNGPRPAYSQKPIVLKIEIPVPVTSILFENFKMFAERVDKMSGGRLKIETLPAGAVVGAFEILDAVSRGVLDGGHSWVGYWVGKNMAAGLLAGAPAGTWGMDQLDYYGWLYEGGGIELYQEFYDLVGANVVCVGPVAMVGPQMLGWFKKPIKNLDEFTKLKYRVPGIAADVYKEMGVSVVTLPGGEILPAGERGVIDGAEWLTPADDIRLGFHTVWKFMISPCFHDYVPTWDVFINRDVWKKLPADLQEILKGACAETSLRHWVRHNKQNAEAMAELKKLGVTVLKTPDDILQKFLETWVKVVEREAAKDPFVKKVYESQKRYANFMRTYRLHIPPPYEFAAGFFEKLEKK